MAFHIRPDESFIHGLRRLARKELASARDGLEQSREPDEDAIHEARKSVKKVRALVRVVKSDKGRGLRKTAKRLRDVNRVLSHSRDADAMEETLSTLLKVQPRVLSEHTERRLQRQLARHKAKVAAAADREDAWEDVIDQLRAARADVKRWSPAHSRFEALVHGLGETHKRGRKALIRALETRRAADFHEWRKQIKALRYELRLIEEAGSAIHRDVTKLDEAGESLGNDHNVVVLLAYLSDTHASAYDASEWQRLCSHAERYQQRRRREAIAKAGRIYKTATALYLRRMKRTWTCWARQCRAGHVTHRPRRARS